MIFTDNVATLIHDLKTPVSAQERVLELLLKNNFGELTCTQSEIISQIKDSCIYLKTLIQKAMSDYISDCTEIKIKPECFCFQDEIYLAVEDLKPLAEEKHQTILINNNPKVYLYADKFHLKRVLINLISNAIKYSFNNSEIQIKFKQTNKNFIFTVTNNAPEIRNLDRVFNKFESKNNSGLGLYLVKKVITAHNGKVFVKEETKNKYSFGFVIPNV